MKNIKTIIASILYTLISAIGLYVFALRDNLIWGGVLVLTIFVVSMTSEIVAIWKGEKNTF